LTATLVKICGITRVEDAVLAVELGADWLGLNFVPASPRHVDRARARAIARAVAGEVGLVGVFVDAPLAQVEDLLAEVGLDLAQLHGDEPAAALESLAARDRLLRVFHGVPAQAAVEASPPAALFLVDAAHAALRGGTGVSWQWREVAGLRFSAPLLVAGGIRPDNVAAALAASGAAGVDVASGVESAPGIKDPGKMESLFREVRRAAKTSRS
jgi:phosphoribosylanthranilate isomerase